MSLYSHSVALWLYSVNCMHWHNRVYHHIHYSSHYGCIVSTVCTGTTEYIITSISATLWLYSVNCMHWHNRVYHHIHYSSHYGCIVSTVCTGTSNGCDDISSHPYLSHYGCIVSTVCTGIIHITSILRRSMDVMCQLYALAQQSISSHPLLVAIHYGCIVSTVCTGTIEYIITSITRHTMAV